MVNANDNQQTLAKPVSVEGRGLFSGDPANVTFRPAPTNEGITFVRSDLGDTPIPALVQNVVKDTRRTTLKNGDSTVATCEHCMSALAALGIDNARIEIDGPELPGLDGSAAPYLEVLSEAGIVASDEPRHRLVISEPVVVRDGNAMISAVPNDQPFMEVVYDLDYGTKSPIHRQLHSFSMSNGNYADQIAPARTYVLEEEARQLRAAGMGKHLSADELLVITKNGPMGRNKYRFDDELVRHKIVDLIGDLYLLGAPIQGRIIAMKSGHALNHALVRELVKQHKKQRRGRLATSESVLDIRAISRILPHRYPMLLVDRVIELDGDTRVVGVKNVSINEPFFQGHYPGTPIMPGVLIVEAMAQLSGVLIGQSLEHTGKLAVLLSLDRVKLRKPVMPGDQLIMEAENVRVRARIAHVRCKAFVGDTLAAEAEVKFMLLDDEQD